MKRQWQNEFASAKSRALGAQPRTWRRPRPVLGVGHALTKEQPRHSHLGTVPVAEGQGHCSGTMGPWGWVRPTMDGGLGHHATAPGMPRYGWGLVPPRPTAGLRPSMAASLSCRGFRCETEGRGRFWERENRENGRVDGSIEVSMWIERSRNPCWCGKIVCRRACLVEIPPRAGVGWLFFPFPVSFFPTIFFLFLNVFFFNYSWIS